MGTFSEDARTSETTPLAPSLERAESKRWPYGVWVVLAAGIATVGAALSREAPTAALSAGAAELATAQSAMSLAVNNAYERSLGIKIGDGLLPFDNLVEMWQPTRLELSDSRGDNGPYRWNVTGVHGIEAESLVGDSVEVTFVALGEQQLVVTDGHGLDVYFNVNAKYVRRELRDLSVEDREIYFEALHTLYFTEQAEGEKRYGPMFKSASWLVREHLYGAAQKDCDHWHDDAGFYTHHIGVTLQFEQSLRSVDARTCSHYWDYTVDAKAAENGVSYADSEIFSDDWFGKANPSGADHAIDTGRFAYTPVMSDARSFSNITNAHGLLRSPWNTNPVPYVMRHNIVVGEPLGDYNLPTCADFQFYTGSSISMADVVAALNGHLHGPVHIMLGGHWGFDPALVERVHAAINRNTSKGIYSTDQFLLASKFLWRQGYIECPETCVASSETTADAAAAAGEAQECTCSINRELWDGSDSDALRILTEAGISDIAYKALDEWGPGDSSINENSIGLAAGEILGLLGHVGHPGEMFTSAAPNDPSFWPLHGMPERFVQLIRHAAMKGVLTLNETWGYTHHTMVLSDTHLVCDWSEVNSKGDAASNKARPECYQGRTCSGHRKDDLLPFKDLLIDSPTPGNGAYMTNMEFYETLSPWNKDLPYVYDKLTTWPACENGTLFAGVDWD